MAIKLLLVEDNSGDIELIKYYIEEIEGLDIELTYVKSLDDAVGCFKETSFDLIFTDLNLPDSSGENTVIKLLDNVNDVPIVVLTGMDSYELGMNLLKKGIHDFITKEDLNSRILFKTIYYVIEKNKMLKTIQTLAYKDSLTGLYNRAGFVKILNTRLDAILDNSIALIYFDLDSFKIINDVFGHTFGDIVISEFAKKVQEILNDEHVFARMDGDEFVILIQSMTANKEAEGIVAQLFSTFCEPITIHEQLIKISLSVGVSLYPQHADNAEDLIKFADIAMYKAKEKKGYSQEFFSNEMINGLEYRFMLNTEIHHALENDEFSLVYQPIIDTRTNRIYSVEALLRWNNKKYGHISPVVFIPLTEFSHEIVPIGIWVLSEACNTIKLLNDSYNQSIALSVNVSPIQIQEDDFIESVIQVIKNSQMDMTKLTLEITENISFTNDSLTIDKLTILRNNGILIAVDDFGTGYASFNRLNSNLLSEIKIDKSFIQSDMLYKSSLVTDIIRMGQNLELDVVAEGIETKQQLEYLIANDCHLIQGYLFSKPLSFEDLKIFITNYG